MTNRPALILAVLASIMGAAGVALAALATHENGGELAHTAALFLILHAAATVAVATHARFARSGALVVVGFVMAAGASVFAADLARSAFYGARLFPYAAPIGGSAMIVAWAALAIVFAVSAARR